jgi:hypothetical protein
LLFEGGKIDRVLALLALFPIMGDDLSGIRFRPLAMILPLIGPIVFQMSGPPPRIRDPVLFSGWRATLATSGYPFSFVVR